MRAEENRSSPTVSATRTAAATDSRRPVWDSSGQSRKTSTETTTAMFVACPEGRSSRGVGDRVVDHGAGALHDQAGESEEPADHERGKAHSARGRRPLASHAHTATRTPTACTHRLGGLLDRDEERARPEERVKSVADLMTPSSNRIRGLNCSRTSRARSTIGRATTTAAAAPRRARADLEAVPSLGRGREQARHQPRHHADDEQAARPRR